MLAERGLDPALSALAARSPVPVTVDVGPEVASRRLDPTVEAVAYFVVAEALTNVTRHAEAKRADVRVSLTGIGDSSCRCRTTVVAARRQRQDPGFQV